MSGDTSTSPSHTSSVGDHAPRPATRTGTRGTLLYEPGGVRSLRETSDEDHASTGGEVGQLLRRAADGERQAWDELVDRYARLVWSVARSFGLDDATTSDVSQTVWLRLVEHCTAIRQPERLAAWLATTTRREALRVLDGQRRQQPSETVATTPDRTNPPPDELLINDELQREMFDAFRRLPDRCQQLLRLLTAEPRLNYATISEMIGRPIGSIGPTRARCLQHLRTLMAHPARGQPR